MKKLSPINNLLLLSLALISMPSIAANKTPEKSPYAQNPNADKVAHDLDMILHHGCGVTLSDAQTEKIKETDMYATVLTVNTWAPSAYHDYLITAKKTLRCTHLDNWATRTQNTFLKEQNKLKSKATPSDQ